MTLWVFGDSYTADGRKTIGSNNWQHIENTWVELLTKKLNVSNNNVFAIPGVSNEWIYGKLLQEQNNFQPGDYIIIQPTCATRRWLIERCPELANWQHLSANNKFLTKDEVSALDSFRRYLINEQVELYNYDMFIRAVMFISQN